MCQNMPGIKVLLILLNANNRNKQTKINQHKWWQKKKKKKKKKTHDEM